MEILPFFIMNTVILAVILVLERKKIKNYVLLGIFTMILAIIFENIMVYLGTWSYHLEPKIGRVSAITIIFYFHYIIFCYFIAHKIKGLLHKNES